MKNSIYTLCFVMTFCVAEGAASAEEAEPVPRADVPVADGAAGESSTAAEETYLPGPGGGTVDPNGKLILESTGLEDGFGGCKCSNAIGAASGAGSPVLALLASLALLRRRRLRSER